MFGYYLDLAWRSLRRTPILTGLMVLAIGLGIGASMTMITVLHVMSGDPLPGRSARLFVPMLDPRPPGQDSGPTGIRGTPDAFTWTDVMNLLHAARADGQAAMSAGSVAIQPARADLHPFFERGHYVTADFFKMFGVPFRAGSGWTAAQDENHARVVVLNSTLDRKLFGNVTGIGRTISLNNTDFRVIGVVNDWHPQPKFYAQRGEHIFGEADQFFLPLQTALELKFSFNGHFACWGSGGDDRKSDHCTWLQFWVALDSPAKVAAYRRFLDDYWHDQQDHGRFPRKDAPPRLYDLMAWLAHEQVIPANLSMQMWLAIGFLCVCMLSVMALLLAKFLRRSGEVSVRRALGARRRDIFAQFGIESALIGAAGGVLGLLIAQFGLWSIRQRPDGYAHLAQMDVPMLVGTVVLAVVASVLAGLLPAWRACLVPPALQLKAQ
ncbi:MAG: ABC transporter, ATP-binding protein [Rhodanobacteraceae bacterium]|jgi:putative ABC transport system permease protein|nr:MAG: ABC transporter, ATP-binding protein [Rhodanobacteraceae bacterium]